MILYMEHWKKTVQKAKTFRKVAGYKINMQKSVVSIY